MANHKRDPRSQDFYDIHHLLWPRSAYRGSIETRFRGLACNKVKMQRRDHCELHAHDAPPKKPSHGYMLAVLRLHKEGKCPQCVPVKATSTAA